MSNSGEVETQIPVMENPVTENQAEKMEVDAKDEKKPKRERKQKVVKEKKAKSPSHPPYFQMMKEAITALNEKGGSSPYAIAKYIENKHKAVLPTNFRKILGLQLKNCVSNGKLIKVKASYKLSEAGKKRAKTATTKAARANAAKEPAKRRKPKSKAVSKLDIPATPTARRSKRTTTTRKLKTIKPAVAKKAAA
ncbi:histone H1-like [Amaranthus tricolor]|uniref:histone H1-like n=1 Tax=Amaranthus tricolor TaxID=29722 RepID=UPI00258CB500|nr:histone H1-like [Amaranthus tricolor]